MVTLCILKNGYGSSRLRNLIIPAILSLLMAGCATAPNDYPAPSPAVPVQAPEPMPVAAAPAPAPAVALPSPAYLPAPVIGPLDGAVLTRVYYATNRVRVGRTFGQRRNVPAAGLDYGSVVVSLPENRKPGEIPVQPWYGQFTNNKVRKYVLLHPLRPLTKDEFFFRVSEATQGVPKKAAFVYVHGYNNSFDDAARRTGQIAVDLKLPVVPVMFSWPSTATLSGYQRDLTNAEASVGHLEIFLRDFAQRSSAEKIFVIAHSMGNLVTTKAMKSLVANHRGMSERFTQVVLAAPDIDPVIFKNEIAPQFSALRMPVTIYSSRKDKALLASKAFHTRLRMRKLRLGHPDSIVDTIDGFDFIDVSSLPTNFMGHDYIGSNSALLNDMSLLFDSGKRAKDRKGLSAYPPPIPNRWKFP